MPFYQRVFYRFWWWVCLIVATFVFRFRRFGLHNVPKEGPFLIVANHESFLDPVITGLAIAHKPVTALARKSLFKNPIFGAVLRSIGVTPIDDNGGDIATIKLSIRLLREGHVVSLFPEGSRTHDGKIQPFKKGALLLIRKSTAPILPIAVAGAYKTWPRSQKLPKFFGNHVAINVGKPIDHDDLLKDGPDAALRRLEQVIQALRDEMDPIIDSHGRRV